MSKTSSYNETRWAKRFNGITSVRKRCIVHVKLAKSVQREICDEKERAAKMLEKKLLGLDPGSDEAKLLRAQIRDLNDLIAEIKRQPPLRLPLEAMRMGY